MRTAKLIAILLLVHSSVARADQEQEAAKRAARARFVDGDLAFKDGKDDHLVKMAVKDGKVGGFWIQ